MTIAISDVPGDDPSVIGSGPTVPDPTTLAEARAIVAQIQTRSSATPSRARSTMLRNESPKPGDPTFAGSEVRTGSAAGRCDARGRSGRARRRLRMHLARRPTSKARRATSLPRTRVSRAICGRKGKRAVILSGGELTVTMRGKGRGGPNQEYALALAMALAGMPAVAAIAGDTDGTDGGGGAATDPAGALVDGESTARAKALGLDPAAFLADNNSSAFFAALGRLVEPGPTYTNVNDFRAIVVDRTVTDHARTRIIRNPRQHVTASLLINVRCRLCFSVACAAVAPALLLGASISPAKADFRLCNNTGSRVGVAIGYKDNEGWTTEGWWNVSSRSCETLLRGALGRALLLHLRRRL